MKSGVFKLGVVFLLGMLLVSLFSVLVIAEEEDNFELNRCIEGCKLNFESEEDRSPCVIECKNKWEFKEGGYEDDFEDKVKVCHIPLGNLDNEHTLEISESAVEDHLDHGDSLGECREGIDFDEVEKEYSDVEIVDGGIGPDSVFYFLDKFMDRFGDDLEVREEKIAEIKAMIEKGDFESARKSLKIYKERIKALKKEVDPEKRDEARRSAVAIKKALNEIKDSIPEENQKEFVDDILEDELGIITAVEISSKISELCGQLAELDPFEYDRVCNIDDDAPEWRKKKHKKWTEEQRKEAAEFGSIMKDCFRSSGRECRCEDIGFVDFSVACEKASAFAIECDEGVEESCIALDKIDMPELPEHLQDVFDEVEAKEAQYDNHMPYECVEAGATTPQECTKVMIETGAPEECKQVLLDSGCEQERECRKICDEIMFDLHAPRECIDEGITDPSECGRFMDSFRDDKRGPGFGPDCMSISDDMERLKCFEGKLSDSGDRYGPGPDMPDGEITWQCKENRIHWPPDCEKFMREELPEQERRESEERNEEIKQREKECADRCESEGVAWDFTGGYCNCFDHQEGGEGYDCNVMYCGQGSHCEPDFGCVSDGGSDEHQGPSCDNCASQCDSLSGQRLSGTGCGSNGCECYYESDELQYGEGEGSGDFDDSGEPPVSGGGGGGGGIESESAPITGGVVNEFLDYYYG